MKKIAFLYFEELHHLHHFIGVVSEFIKQRKYEVNILTYEGEHEYLFELCDLLSIPQNAVIQLATYKTRKIYDKIRNRSIPSNKYLYEKHKAFILGYNALIFTDTNHGYLYSNCNSHNKPKFVYIKHGPSVGEYVLNDALNMFDLVLVSGLQSKNIFLENTILDKEKIKLIGYCKKEVAKKENNKKQFFKNGKEVVLYNPHFKKELSSWYKNGVEVLEYFYNQDEYNLIFAPHVNLFYKKGYAKENEIDKKYYNSPNILIDLKSNNSVNMAYTLNSDVYLGDVSSQKLEFLLKPRPCIFINSHNNDWGNDTLYRNNELGKIVKNIDDLGELLSTKEEWQKGYLTNQKEIINYTFDIDLEKSSCKRAMEEIIKIIEV